MTSTDDARAAVLMGADLLGMVMHQQSPRFCSPSRAFEISRDFYFRPRVFVFADDDIDYAQYLLGEFSDDLTFLQMPAHTGLYYWAKEKFSPGKIIPVISVNTSFNPEEIEHYREFPWIIFDTGGIKSESGENLYGGTGKTFDWSLLSSLDRRYFIAGGLNPENINQAILTTNAAGFDVSSGIEKSHGKKDYEKMSRFIETVRKS